MITHGVVNGVCRPVAIRMTGVVVGMRPSHSGTEATEHDSQNRYPVHRADQRFCTKCARRAPERSGSRLYIDVWYPLLSLHRDDPLIRVT